MELECNKRGTKLNFYYGHYGEEIAKEKAKGGAVVFDGSTQTVYVDGIPFNGDGSSEIKDEILEEIRGGASKDFDTLAEVEVELVKQRAEIDELMDGSASGGASWSEYDVSAY